MYKATFASSIAGLFLGISLLYPAFSAAQVAPTNTATISGSVEDSSGNPVANAKIAITGPKNIGGTTDGHGLFVFVGMPLGKYQIAASAENLGTATREISVDGDVNVAIQYEPSGVNGLKVIANVNSVANARFNVTSASVTQVNPMAAAFSGQTSWRKILEQIPGVSQGSFTNGSLNFQSLPDGPLMPMEISINGALPYETATLLDDMPLISGQNDNIDVSNPGAGTNLAGYALNSFTSADVVRGPGANAPSIVDSIGGSFLLHSPGMVQQNHYALSVSSDPYGGIVSNALVALRIKRLSVTMTYGVNDSPGPVNMTTFDLNGYQAPSKIDGFTCHCSNTALVGGNFSGYAQYGEQTGLILCCVNVSTAWSQHSGSMTLDYAVSPGIEASVYYSGQSSSMSLPYAAYYGIFAPPAGYAGALPAGQLQYFSGGQELGNANPFVASSSLLEEKISAHLGAGMLRLAALQGVSDQENSYDAPASGSFQLFGGACLAEAGPQGSCPAGYSQQLFNGGAVHTVGYSFALQEYANSASDSRDILASYVTPLLGGNYHIGASYVQSFYNDPLQENSVNPNTGIHTTDCRPSTVSETTREARLFVGGSPTAKTSFDLSFYMTDADYHIPNPSGLNFATFTSTTGWLDQHYTYAAPRLGFIWRPSASVAVRASAGGGFALAPLNNLLGSSIPYNLGTYYEAFAANLNLQPEKSFAFDLGTDIRLKRNMVASLDVYRSNLFGQIYCTTTVTSTNYNGSGLPLYTTEDGNLAESRYEGILVELRSDVARGVYWKLSGGLTRGYVVSVPPGFYNDPSTNCVNCTNAYVVVGPNFNGSFTNGVSVPYAQGLGQIGYRWSPEKSIGLTATYFGNNNSYYRPAFVEFDGNVSYPLAKGTTLSLAFRNITGVYDGTYMSLSPGAIYGVPTVFGAPYPEFSQQYGPRTVIMTLNFSH